MRTKVFCIGFHKTGTTSLAVALRTLGYRVTGPNGVYDPDIAQNVLPMAYRLAEQYDAFQDNPWPVIFRELDRRYPGSKFILTVRDSNSWIKSQVMHFGCRETPMRRWIYGAGCPEGNEAAYVRRFEMHTRQVLDHFKARSNDLLVMDLAAGDGWEELCRFLGAPVPRVPFPHVNRANERNGHNSQPGMRVGHFIRRVVRNLKGIVRSVM